MEFVFLLISIIFTLLVVYLIGRLNYSHQGLIRAYKTSEFLFPIHLIFGVLMIMLIFMTLCAFNNTFWGLPYLTQ
jgi:diacylglycerol kinase